VADAARRVTEEQTNDALNALESALDVLAAIDNDAVDAPDKNCPDCNLTRALKPEHRPDEREREKP
jgi:hypothetical protein